MFSLFHTLGGELVSLLLVAARAGQKTELGAPRGMQYIFRHSDIWLTNESMNIGGILYLHESSKHFWHVNRYIWGFRIL